MKKIGVYSHYGITDVTVKERDERGPSESQIQPW
jgi:hypothetical protein